MTRATPQNQCKYIFVTGGVVSSLGKGLASATIASLLEAHGLRVANQKFDPYLNVDPGTMSPFQHGEVYVTDDGAETDLDLGHYERLSSGRSELSRLNSTTTGQIYSEVIRREREGGYLGKTVQVVPHVTDEIKSRIYRLADEGYDVIVCEIGGTIGDIEGLPYIEAIRQVRYDVGRANCLYLHLTLAPYLRAAGELKTKPTQHSVHQLRAIGIQPDMLLIRTEKRFPTDVAEKIAMFCNVDEDCVFQSWDLNDIYKMPMAYLEQGIDKKIIEILKLEAPNKAGDFAAWQQLAERIDSDRPDLKIGFVGKYVELQDAYKSIYEALHHGGLANSVQVKTVRIEADELTEETAASLLSGMDGILVPGGFGQRGTEGKIVAAKFARENKIPYFGICLGLQVAVVEFARNVCKMKGAHSTEFNENTPYPVIDLMESQKAIVNLGGTMRLGKYDCKLIEGTKAHEAYGVASVSERHRHRYEVNNALLPQLSENGLIVSGTNPKTGLVEIIELADHPWFVGCQFHPEFKSKPLAPHPLFYRFIEAAKKASGQ